MAKIYEMNEQEQEEWDKWLESKPPCIKKMALEFMPNKLYLLKSSNHRVTINSYSEDGTMTVFVSGKFNLLAFERGVFGIHPLDLEECALPLPDEVLGVLLNESQSEDFLDLQRNRTRITNFEII